MADENLLNKITSLSKRRGFVYASSEIYGGWEATYDFGPLGAEMLRNLRNLWWDYYVTKQPDIVGLDGALISHPRVWEASGHVESFNDVMVEDLVSHKRYRADHIIEDALNINVDGFSPEEISKIIKENNIKSPEGNGLSDPKQFNNLVEVYVGTLDNEKEKAYLRGETCQPIFYNYKLVKDSMRKKIPFGIAQIGKAFRNEIKVGPFFFRTREFEQMEVEMFIHSDDHDKYFSWFKEYGMSFLTSLGISEDKLRFREQEFKERAHYNKVATDIEYEFPFGWKEFQGIHYRSDWDLKRHGEFSGENFEYMDQERDEKYIPHIVESSIGLSRLMLVLLCDAYKEDGDRVYLSLDKKVAPYRVAVFPLMKNKTELVEKAQKIFEDLLSQGYSVAWDDRGNVGKRYYSQDEIGTPYCVTVDYQTLEDAKVTIRDRDTAAQKRINILDISEAID